MSGFQRPPWVVDAFASEPYEKRLAERYRQAAGHGQLEGRGASVRERTVLLARLRAAGPYTAYMWLSEAVLDAPEVLREMPVGAVLNQAVGTTVAAPDHFLYLAWGDLMAYQRRWLSSSLRLFAG